MGQNSRWEKMKRFTLDKLNPFEQYRRPKTKHVKQSEVMDAIDKILPKAPKGTTMTKFLVPPPKGSTFLFGSQYTIKRQKK